MNNKLMQKIVLSKNMKYHEVEPIDHGLAIDALSSNKAETIINVMLSIAYHDPEWEWAQERYIELLNHDDVRVSSIAALCLGHIARIHGHIDKMRVVPALKAKLKNKDPKLVEMVKIALGDIKMFLG